MGWTSTKIDVEWLRENIDVVGGVPVSLGLAILSAAGVEPVQKFVLPATLAVLVLLMTITFRLRKQYSQLMSADRKQADTLAEIEEWLVGNGSADAFLGHEYPGLGPLILTARSMDIIGTPSFRPTVGAYHAQISKMASKGGRVRMICSNPGNVELMASAALSRAYWPDDDGFTSDVRINLKLARSVRDKLPEGHFCEIRTTDTLPSVGMVKLNGGEGDGIIYVKVMIPGHTDGTYPVFSLRERRDSAWYVQFTASFESLWESAERID